MRLIHGWKKWKVQNKARKSQVGLAMNGLILFTTDVQKPLAILDLDLYYPFFYVIGIPNRNKGGAWLHKK